MFTEETKLIQQRDQKLPPEVTISKLSTKEEIRFRGKA